MNENANVSIATPKKITSELIGGYFLWGIVYGLIWSVLKVIFDGFKEMIEYTPGLLIAITVGIALLGALFTYLIWKGSVKSTFKKRTIKSSDVPKVMKNLAIFMTIITIISVGYLIFQAKISVDSLNEYRSNAEVIYGDLTVDSDIAMQIRETRNVIYAMYTITGVSEVVINIFMYSRLKKMLRDRAVKDEPENAQDSVISDVENSERKLPGSATALILVGGIIFLVALILAIVAISNSGQGGVKNSTNTLPDQYQNFTLEEVTAIANEGLKEAKENSPAQSYIEYYKFVIDYMSKKGVNVDDYDIVVSMFTVIVTEKEKDEYIEDNKNSGNVEQPGNDTANNQENSQDKPDNDTNNSEDVPNNTNPEKPDNEKIPPASSEVSKGYIYNASYEYNVSKTSYTTNYNKTFYIKDIVVPYINIDSVDAKSANNEIKAVFNKAIEVYKNGISDKTSGVDKCDYIYTIKGNVLSVQLVLTTSGTDVPKSEYYTYNFNTKTGKALTYSEVYRQAGIDGQDIDLHVSIAISKYVKDQLINITYSGNENLATYINSSVKNYEDSKQNGTLKYYIDTNNQLNVLVKIKLPVGRGEFDTIISVNPKDLAATIPEYSQIIDDLNVAYAELKVDSVAGGASAISNLDAIKKYNIVLDKWAGGLLTEKLSEQNKKVNYVVGNTGDKINLTISLLDNGGFKTSAKYNYKINTTSISDVLANITTLTELRNNNMSEITVRELVYETIWGKFAYPITVRYGKNNDDVLVITGRNVGYTCKETTSQVPYNSPYAKIDSGYMVFSETNKNTQLQEQEVDDVIRNGKYACEIIKNRTSAELGLYIYIQE